MRKEKLIAHEEKANLYTKIHENLGPYFYSIAHQTRYRIGRKRRESFIGSASIESKTNHFLKVIDK